MKRFPWVPLFAISLLAGAIAAVACTSEEGASPPTATPTPQPAFTVLVPVDHEPITPLSKGDTAIPPPDALRRPSGSFGFSHYVFEEVGGKVVTTLVEGPRENQVRSTLSYLKLKELYDQGEPIPEGIRMSREELGELVRQLETVREATGKYRDVKAALADGYVQLTEDVPNMGAHFASVQRGLDGVFDPAQPEILLYGRDANGNWELMGTSFVLPIQRFGHNHPEAFAGPLDNWHVHYSLCTSIQASSRSATREECNARGGTWVDSFGWMIHAWVWVDNPLGVFGMWNPNVPPVAQASDIRQSRSATISQKGVESLAIENFGHREARLKVGQTADWTNVDGVPHTVTSGSGGVAERRFDSGYIAPGQSFALRFDQPGEYSYVCTLHLFMSATITVTE